MEKEWEMKHDLMSSLNYFSEKIICWNRDTFSCFFKRKKRVKRRLEGVMKALDIKVTEGLLKLELKLK